MSIQKFEDSFAWQKAMDLCELVDIEFENSKRFAFKDQIFRASLSICNNIAEGFEMSTRAHRIKYLVIAKGSCNEVRSMLHFAKRRGYMDAQQVEKALRLCDEVGKLLRKYMDNSAGGWGRLPGAIPLMLIWATLT